MSGHQPIAQIFCRHIEERHPKCVGPGKGFIDSQQKEKYSNPKHHAALDILLFANQVIHIGRNIQNNDVTIRHPYISRHHFLLYSVQYGEDDDDVEVEPLVYVRDCNSLGGTHVADRSTRPEKLKKLSPSVGYLLSQGQVIRLNPYWEFHIHLLSTQRTHHPMSQLQLSQINLLRDRFLITDRIVGRGGLAVVYLAANPKTGQQVACKIHRFHKFQRSPSIVRRILNETNILSRLSHPNLLKFEAAFRSSDTLYTFTELATGGDLFSMRDQYPDGLPEMDVKVIVRQILAAVSYLHEQNVAHRDIKPENVFFATGPTHMTRVIVGDLGFAKVATSGRMASRIGTQEFMAPEVYRGQSYGTKVDIWSIGMVSLFLVVFEWKRLDSLMTYDQNTVDEVLEEVFEDLSTQDKALSNDFKDFIRSCLTVEPSCRMTAVSCKKHGWFCSSIHRLNAQIEEFTQGWKPARIVHNSVEDLDLFRNTNLQSSAPMMSLNKRKAPDDKELLSLQNSCYFTNGGSTGHKRQKVVLKVTQPSQ
ncbi:kinase-like protein [Xylariaceae sp. AK1471]|nr:kinase-like protein [Xylariaceae sp. AK1471]